MVMQERLYVTADRQVAVQEGDKRAAFLLIAKGQEIPNVVAKQYKIIDGRLKQSKKPANKMAEKSDNKFVTQSENKEKKNG